ncbi:unnamed protein product [Pylaiella littoralis]
MGKCFVRNTSDAAGLGVVKSSFGSLFITCLSVCRSRRPFLSLNLFVESRISEPVSFGVIMRIIHQNTFSVTERKLDFEVHSNRSVFACICQHCRSKYTCM